MLRPLFAAFFLLALLGDARIFLFVINHLVFGSHREEKSRLHWLLYAVPPLLLALTALFWPLNEWIERLLETRAIERITPERLEAIAWSLALAKLGAVWLIVAAGVGAYWILDRIRANYFGEPPLEGVRELDAEVIRQGRRRDRFRSINDVYDLEVTRNEVFIDDLPAPFDGYRIAFLTDTHVASFVRRAFHEEIVAQVRRFDPDLLLFGGDFVTFRRHIPLLAERFAGLSAKDGMFAILGNHDYWSDAPRIIETLGSLGVRFITNAHVVLARGGARLPLAGIDEVYRGTPDPDAAFSGIGVDQLCLAISHHPDIIDVLPRRRIDLLLCGHTHGGQIRFPFFGAVVVPSKHEAMYAAGFHRVGPTLMYVSRGIGAIPPLRILCRPEVATFVLRRGHRTPS
jgi:predicted MPP superfamily phosphohydrolase